MSLQRGQLVLDTPFLLDSVTPSRCWKLGAEWLFVGRLRRTYAASSSWGNVTFLRHVYCTRAHSLAIPAGVVSSIHFQMTVGAEFILEPKGKNCIMLFLPLFVSGLHCIAFSGALESSADWITVPKFQSFLKNLLYFITIFPCSFAMWFSLPAV